MSVVLCLILIILEIRVWVPTKQQCSANLLTVKYKLDVTDDLMLGEAFRASAAAKRNLTEVAFKFPSCSLLSFFTKCSALTEMFSAPPHPKGKAAISGNAPGNVYKQH